MLLLANIALVARLLSRLMCLVVFFAGSPLSFWIVVKSRLTVG